MITNVKALYAFRIHEKFTEIPLSSVLDDIQNGYYENDVDLCHRDGNYEENKKKYLPCFTLSFFKDDRCGENFVESEFFIYDVDKIEDETQYNTIRSKLIEDKRVVALFKSPSRKGIKFIVQTSKITSSELFTFNYEYYLEELSRNIDFDIDIKCKDSTRVCFVSHDPDLFRRCDNEIIQLIEPPIKSSKSNNKTNTNNYPKLLNKKYDSAVEFLAGRIPDYGTWIKIGFACASKGEDGRELFMRLSSNNINYYNDTEDKINQQFDTCLKNYDKEKTKFYHILQYAGGLGWKYEKDEENEVDIIESFLKEKKIIENEITGDLEDENGLIVNDRYLKYLWRELFKIKPISYKVFYDVADSSNLFPVINPIKEFFQNNTIESEGNIDKLLNCMNLTNDYIKVFIKKWLVGVVRGVLGEKINELTLVLVGPQNTGKTVLIRELPPKELQKFCCDSKLDDGKDSELIMTRHMIICDDEFGGKSKSDSKRYKELSSKQKIKVRAVWRRKEEEYKRIASLCGTTNDMGLINDYTGNRRIIPVYIGEKMNWQLYNSINKKDLWLEIYELYKSGTISPDLSSEDIEILNKNTKEFEVINIERELLLKHFNFDEDGDTDLQTTEIKSILEEKYKQLLNTNRLGAELKKLGKMREYRNRKYVYKMRLNLFV